MFQFDIFINDRFWRTLEYNFEPGLARIMEDIMAARYLGQLNDYLINGQMSVRIIPYTQK